MANLDASYDVDNRTKAFALHESGVLVCLAGPGTGKTYFLLARTAALAACFPPRQFQLTKRTLELREDRCFVCW